MSLGSSCPLVPASDLHFVKGAPLSIGDRSGVVVVEMWATWCPPCRSSIPHLTQVAQKFKERGLIILGVTKETDIAKIDKFVETMGDKMNYTVAIDINSAVTTGLYEVSDAGGIPHAWVIGADGVIAWAGHPMDDEFEGAIDAALTAAGK